MHLATPPYAASFFVIDPLDGTKEFIAGRDEFTINLAIVTDGVPLLGIIGAPALGSIWRGLVGHGAQRLTVTPDASVGAAEPIATRPFPGPAPHGLPPSVVHTATAASDAFIDGRPGAIRKPLGSAVKFCRIAEGGADIYPRLAPTGEWDVAAGHALVAAAGGKITDERGAALRFGESRRGISGAGVYRLGRSVGCALTRTASWPAATAPAFPSARPSGALPRADNARIRSESRATVLMAKQVKPLANNQPEPRGAGESHAPRNIHRIIAAETWTINVGICDEKRPIAGVAEAPDRAS